MIYLMMDVVLPVTFELGRRAQTARAQTHCPDKRDSVQCRAAESTPTGAKRHRVMHTPRRLILSSVQIAFAVVASVQGMPANQNAADLGSISGNVYTNDSLGMTYEFPKGWVVDRAWMDAQNKPAEVGARPTDPEEAAKYDSMVAMRKGTHALLAVSEKGTDNAQSSARIQLTVSPRFDDKTGLDVLNGMKSAYDHVRLIQIVGDPANYTFGGATFARMDMRLLDVILRGGAGFQSAIIGVRNQQYLQFLIVANTQERLDAIVHSLDSLRFQ